MTLQQLIYAVKIADLKSMNKAAAALYVSQSALSAAVRALEEEIHTELFVRSNRGITITQSGEEFLSYARQMTELQRMIEERYTDNKTLKKGSACRCSTTLLLLRHLLSWQKNLVWMSTNSPCMRRRPAK